MSSDLKMKPEIKKLWVDALRSGEYIQTKGRLHKDGCHCVLGVLCELSVKHGISKRTEKYGITYYDDRYAVLSIGIREWSGLDDGVGYIFDDKDKSAVTSLIELNDKGKTFLELADIIEEKF